MSRRRNRARAQSQTGSAQATSASGSLAEARRQARMQARAQAEAPAAVLAPADAEVDEDEDLHRRAVQLREIRMGLRAAPVGPKAHVTIAGNISMTFPVMGMTCRSCEVRIGKFVGRLPNVERVAASAVKGEVVVECSAPVAAATIERPPRR